MKDQEPKEIRVKDLVLWTENPRDPISENATDQDIVDRAIGDASGKWNLSKLARKMGDNYDFSELPTVVMHNKKPVVYDGNRRIILAKIKHGLVQVPDKFSRIKIPEIPLQIWCNVCTREIALKNILRKHGDSGSWSPLDRDIFLHRFMGEPKSSFLILEEELGIIRRYPEAMNQRFVKEEIFNDTNLDKLGFSLKDGVVRSRHNEEESLLILSEIAQKISDKAISTRGKTRGKALDILEPSTRDLICANALNEFNSITLNYENSSNNLTTTSTATESADNEQKPQDSGINIPDYENLGDKTSPRQSRRTAPKKAELFGRKLFLRSGETSNLYRDIVDLYNFYTNRQHNLSSTFPSLIRMSLRLLCETAAKEKGIQKIDMYLKEYYATAKKNLSQDVKTTLSNQGVTEEKIVQLLQTGAHNYASSSNIEQTIAISIIIGEILTITHGREDKDVRDGINLPLF